MVANIALLRRRQAQSAQKRTAATASIPAPIGGWNARDPVAEMPPTDATLMEDVWPLPYDVMVRKGYTQNTTGIGNQVESLMVYANPTSQKMFAASGTVFYDVSSGGAVGAAVVTGLTNARWQDTNISTSGGNFMLAVNGADKLRGYNGTAWWTDGDGTHDITGVDTATCSTITTIHNRVWLVQSTSLKGWYLPTSSIAGAAQSFDLQAVAMKGGYLIAMGAWTMDAGYGVDDMTAFITSMGEVIVYRGADPANEVSWALAGVWDIGSPFATRCMMKYGGDLLIMTYDGLYPLSQALQSSRLDPKVAITNKIYTEISRATSNYGSNFGWDIAYYAKANMLILNVPNETGSYQQQYVMNTITKAWANFTGLSANCWAIFNDEPYFGGSGFVGKFWDSWSDNGAAIVGDVQGAYNYFNMRGRTKRWTMLRPILTSNGNPSALIGLNIDFTDSPPVGSLSTYGSGAAIWDTATWDSGMWGNDLNVCKQWLGANGQGYCAAVRMQISSSTLETHWASTDFVMEGGQVI